MKEQKVWGFCDNGAIEIISLTEDLVEETILLMRNSFLKHENVSRASDVTRNLKSCQEVEQLFRSCFKEGVSLVAVEKNSGRVVGALANKIYTVESAKNTYEKYMETCTQNTARRFYQVLADCCKLVDPFEKYNVDCLMDLGYLDVHEDFRRKEIGSKLFECSMDLARMLLTGRNVKQSIDGTTLPLDPIPNVVTGLMTSFISQKISKKLKFDRLRDVSYDEMYFEGKSFWTILEGHTKDMWIVAKRL